MVGTWNGLSWGCLSAYLDEGMTAMDVGANIGVFTANFASRVGERGSVHSFEPLATSRRRLQRTLELNVLERVVVNDCAVADRDGEVDLHQYGPGYGSWATVAPREIETADGVLRTARHQTVDVVTVDQYCERHRIERVDVLKVDVEGAEEQVLHGASGMLAGGAIDLVMVEVADTTLSAAGGQAHGSAGPLGAAGPVDVRDRRDTPAADPAGGSAARPDQPHRGFCPGERSPAAAGISQSRVNR